MQRHADAAAAGMGADQRRNGGSKQIEYTWVRSLAGPAQHRDFWQLTRDGLAFVAARHGITEPAAAATTLLRRLSAARRLSRGAAPMLARCAAQAIRTRDPVERRARRCWTTAVERRGWRAAGRTC